jgi:hypothetical protein
MDTMRHVPATRTNLSGDFSASAGPKPLRRKRKGSPVLPIRLTPDERSRLEAMAGETPLATYIKFRLFNGLGPVSRPRGGRPATDTRLIAKLLAALGEARLSQNLNQLAKAANMGNLDVGPDTQRQLVEACAEIKAMRHDLIAALGLKAQGG